MIHIPKTVYISKQNDLIKAVSIWTKHSKPIEYHVYGINHINLPELRIYSGYCDSQVTHRIQDLLNKQTIDYIIKNMNTTLFKIVFYIHKNLDEFLITE